MADIQNYIHSRVETKIIDNSIIEERLVSPIDFTLFQPFISDKGEDGKLLYYRTPDELLKKTGKPNYVKHGLSLLQAHQWLDGGGTVVGLRVTADDAGYACGVLNVRTRKFKKEIEFDFKKPDGTIKKVKKEVDCLMVSPRFMPVKKEILSSQILDPRLSPRLKMKAIMSTIMLGIRDTSSVGTTNTNYMATVKDGWKDNFISLFMYKGSGKYGNEFGVQFNLDRTREEDIYNSRRYFYTVTVRNNDGIVVKAAPSLSISFDPDALDPSGYISEFIDTRIFTTKYASEFDDMHVYTSEAGYENLMKEIGEVCTSVTGEVDGDEVVLLRSINPREVDFLEFKERGSTSSYLRIIPPDPKEYTYLNRSDKKTREGEDGENTNIVSEPETPINQPHQAKLSGGDDGKFDKGKYVIFNKDNDTSKTTAESDAYKDYYKVGLSDEEIKKYVSNTELSKCHTYNDAPLPLKNKIDEIVNNIIYSRYKDAYAGKIDANILSPYKYKVSTIISALYPPEVQKEMIHLSRHRLDIPSYNEFGLNVPNVETAIAIRTNEFKDYNDMHVSYWGQSGQVYDKFSKKYIDVPVTFEIAGMLPRNRKIYGPNKLMAGTKKGLITQMRSFNWMPNEDEKTALLRAQINYVEDVRLDQNAIMSNRTAYQHRLSYLAVIRNVHVICEAIWIARNILTDLRFEEDANVAMTKAEDEITRQLSTFIESGPVERLNVVTEQTLEDAYENAASATIEMKFTDFIQTLKLNAVAAR